MIACAARQGSALSRRHFVDRGGCSVWNSGVRTLSLYLTDGVNSTVCGWLSPDKLWPHRTAGAIGVYTEATEVIVAPKACPFCNSVDVTTTSKTVTVSTYWRYGACGQIWNVGRVQHGRPTRFRPFA